MVWLSGRTTTLHVVDPPSAAAAVLLEGLDTARPGDRAVCDAAQVTGVRYALSFPGPNLDGSDRDFPGLDGLDRSGMVREVASVGEARLYEIVGCR